MLFDSFLIWAASLAAVGIAAWLVVAHCRGERRALKLALLGHADIEARYRAILDNMAMGCMVWEPGFRIVEWNRQAERIFGWARAEALDRSFAAMLLTDDARDSFMRDAAHLLAGGELEGRLPHVTRGGDTIVCQWHHAVLRDGEGAPTQVVSTCINVTALNELQVENALFRRIMDLTDDPSIMLLDAESGRVVHASASAHRHLGRQDLIGALPAEWDAHLSPDIMGDYERALESRKSVCFETEHRHASGRLIPVEVTLNLIEHDGKAYTAAYTRDISSRRAETNRIKNLEITAALREHEKHYREVFENSSDALFTVEVSHGTRLSFDTANPAAEKAFGLPGGLLRGMQFGAFSHGEMGKDFGSSITDHLAEYMSCALTGMPAEYEGSLDLLPGRREDARIYHVQLFPLAADQGIERIICIGHDITLRRRYEADIEARERAFRTLAENIPAPIYRFDRDLRRVYVNPIVAEITGTPIAELLGSTPRDAKVVVPASVEPAMRCIRRVFETGRQDSVDLVYAARGEPREFRMAIVPERDAAGAVATVLAIAHDITEHKRYAAALLERARLQEQLGSVSQAVPGFLFTIRVEADGRTHFPYASAGVDELFGLRPEEFRDDAEVLRARYHPEDRPRLLRAMSETERTLGPLREEIRIQAPQEGEWRWIAIRSTPQRQPDGATEWHGLMIDITEAKQNEQALADGLRFTRELIDAIPNPVFYKDADGRYREINSAFEDTVGKARAEILGKTPLELWPHDLAERYAATDRQLFDSPGSLMYEAQIETPRGRRHAIFHKATLRWADGTVRGQIGVCIDITERKNMERALLASQADLAAREQEFRSLAESSPDHIIRYDLDHRILYLNGCLTRSLGLAGPDEVLGRRPIEVWPDGRFAAIDAAVDAAVATGEARTVHLEVDTGKGRVRHDQVLVVPERDRGGKIVGTLAFGRDITAIRETELALENHLAFTRELIEAIPDPVFYKDTEGRYLGFNTAFERSVGRKREEMIGKGVFELWPRDLAERYFAADRHLIANPGSQVYEAQMQTTDGRRDVVFHKATFTRADGTVGGQIGSYIDITERKRMEAELQEAATLQGTLLDAVNEAGLQLMIIEDGRIDYVSNRRIAHEFGYGDDDIDARPPLLDLVHPDDRMRVADMHRRRVNGEDVPRTYELGLVTRSGERREYETSAIVVPGSDPLRIVTVAKDISERKRHEEELQRREEEFKALAENSPDVIVRYDRECRRTYVNGAYEELHLIPAEALRGKTILEAGPLGEQERAVLHEMVANVIVRGQPSAIETAWQRSDGRSFSYHIRAVPELDRHGKVTGALTVARDITVLKQTERRLEQSQELLQRLSVRREEEYEGERRRVAHELHEEFGQMLTALRINISTLPLQYGQQLPALRQRSESMLELVDRTIQSMRDVVTSLRPPVLDAGISAGLGWLVREFNSKAGIPCSLHAPDVGRAIDDGAAALVLRVVQEALSNVALHARASQVLVRFEREDRAWCAEVRDDGRGFDAGSESHKSLGRFGMEQCALMLGGTLEIDSAPGRGTVLRMNFPAA